MKSSIIVFFVSMVPIIELRGAIPIAESLGLSIFIYYPIKKFIKDMYFNYGKTKIK